MPCCEVDKKEAVARFPAYVADSVLPLLKKGGEGEVLMVNSAGIYLSADQRIIFLCDASWGRVPIGIAMDGFRDVIATLHLEVGQRVSFRENVLFFPCGTLPIEPKRTPAEDSFSKEPRSARIRQAARELVALRKSHGISMLALPLVLEGDATDVTSSDPYAVRAYPLLLSLMRALAAKDGGEVRSCVQALLGLGKGLTPSADDVMLGMLYVFRRLSYESQSVSAFRESISELSLTHTNRVSAAYLKAILDGDSFERMERVFGGICGAVPLDITALTEVGSSSGSEMLLGMLLALRVCGYAVEL